MCDKKYKIYFSNKIWDMSLESLVRFRPQGIWSARISTGLFGLTDCKSGNRGSKENGEILLGLGFEGINYLVNLGFIPCPSCKPNELESFYPSVHYAVWKKYGFKNVEDFSDKKILPFDSRRLNWEKILPIFDKTPSRIYLPKDLKKNELLEFKNRFKKIGYVLPPVGFYDNNIKGHFNEYKI